MKAIKWAAALAVALLVGAFALVLRQRVEAGHPCAREWAECASATEAIERNKPSGFAIRDVCIEAAKKFDRFGPVELSP